MSAGAGTVFAASCAASLEQPQSSTSSATRASCAESAISWSTRVEPFRRLQVTTCPPFYVKLTTCAADELSISDHNREKAGSYYARGSRR
eukprot:6671124-Prymnesium_polylepis.1